MSGDGMHHMYRYVRYATRDVTWSQFSVSYFFLPKNWLRESGGSLPLFPLPRGSRPAPETQVTVLDVFTHTQRSRSQTTSERLIFSPVTSLSATASQSVPV